MYNRDEPSAVSHSVIHRNGLERDSYADTISILVRDDVLP